MATESTQLPNSQSEGLARATCHIEQALHRKQDLAVMLVRVRDVERLSASLGHAQTAALLDEFQTALAAIGHDGDAIERISDRKFAVLIKGLENRGHALLAARKIERIAARIGTKGEEIPNLRANIGIAICPQQGNESHEVLRLAEIASLDGRRNNESVCFFEEQSAQQLVDNWGLEGRLKHALESGDLELHFQPQTSLRSNEIVGAEGLIRWNEPEIGPISPEIFIEVAESTGQIVDLTQFVIHTACRRLIEWADVLPKLRVSVNITPSLIQNTDIIAVLESATKIWDVAPDRLIIEVTENALITDSDASHDVLTQIREFGCPVSIDDFGTGYSSLAYLKELPADELKIDRTFVMGMIEDDGDYKIVEHTIAIAKSFGLSVVAEGVESAAMLTELQKLGCDYAQGYYIAKPMPAGEFQSFCSEYSNSIK